MVDAGPKSPKLRTARLRVTGLCCESEVGLVHNTLEPIEGVTKVSVNVIGQIVIVHYNAAVQEVCVLVDALNKFNLGCSIQSHSGVTPLLS